jgi:hypothetical protein
MAFLQRSHVTLIVLIRERGEVFSFMAAWRMSWDKDNSQVSVRSCGLFVPADITLSMECAVAARRRLEKSLRQVETKSAEYQGQRCLNFFNPNETHQTARKKHKPARKLDALAAEYHRTHDVNIEMEICAFASQMAELQKRQGINLD